jgi:hypothetical protein
MKPKQTPQPLTHNRTAANATLEELDTTSTESDVGPHCDFLVDGQRNAADLRTAADAAANASVTVHIVGLSTDVNSTLLREVATRTGGTYAQARNAGALPAAISRISTETADTDTDDDGLTDGQEVEYVTKRNPGGPLAGPSVEVDDDYSGAEWDEMEADNPDSDGDGYWDGWIGVYDVGYSDNVILYREHLGDGIDESEAVPEVVETHTWNQETRSNVHVGELLITDRSLDVEIDYLAGQRRSLIADTVEAAEWNYGVYGFNINYIVGEEEIGPEDLDPSVFDPHILTGIGDAQEVNRRELDILEDKFDDQSDATWALWGHCMGNDRPKTPIDLTVDWDCSAAGHAFSNGAKKGEQYASGSPYEFGFFIYGNNIGSVQEGQGTVMHETGHLIGIGLNDDKDKLSSVPVITLRTGEVPSGHPGNPDGYPPEDETPERSGTNIGGDEEEWTIMSYGREVYIDNSGPYGRQVFSIEELLTVDFNNIPAED